MPDAEKQAKTHRYRKNSACIFDFFAGSNQDSQKQPSFRPFLVIDDGVIEYCLVASGAA